MKTLLTLRWLSDKKVNGAQLKKSFTDSWFPPKHVVSATWCIFVSSQLYKMIFHISLSFLPSLLKIQMVCMKVFFGCNH